MKNLILFLGLLAVLLLMAASAFADYCTTVSDGGGSYPWTLTTLPPPFTEDGPILPATNQCNFVGQITTNPLVAGFGFVFCPDGHEKGFALEIDISGQQTSGPAKDSFDNYVAIYNGAQFICTLPLFDTTGNVSYWDYTPGVHRYVYTGVLNVDQIDNLRVYYGAKVSVHSSISIGQINAIVTPL